MDRTTNSSAVPNLIFRPLSNSSRPSNCWLCNIQHFGRSPEEHGKSYLLNVAGLQKCNSVTMGQFVNDSPDNRLNRLGDESFLNKLENDIKKSPDLVDIKTINRLLLEKEPLSKRLHEKCIQYVPFTSCDVERIFSSYKNIRYAN